MADWHVLVVEDDPDGREVVTRILRHHKISADVAASAEEGLVMLGKNQYTLAIVDLTLPAMDGWTFLKHVKANPDWAKVPCVAVTAYHSADVAVESIVAGFSAYFPKPLEATSFVRELQRIYG